MALAVIDRSLKPKAGTRLKVTIEKSRWITTLSEDSSGRFTYSDDEAPEVRQTIDVTADDPGIARVKLLTGEPGNWIVRAADESGKELLVIPYGTAGGRLADFAADGRASRQARKNESQCRRHRACLAALPGIGFCPGEL